MIKNIFKDFKSFKIWDWMFVIGVGVFLTIVSFIDLTTLKWVWEDKATWKGVLGVLAGLAAFTGILCVFMVGKGKLSNYFYGIINAITYGLFAFSVGYTGDALLNIFWFLPLQFIGLYMWKRNMTGDTVTEAKLTPLWALFYIALLGVLWVIFYYLIPVLDVKLNGLWDSSYTEYAFANKLLPHLLDSFTNAASITAQVLLLKRLKEQWYLWIIINICQIVMYSGVNGWGVNIPMLVMWSVFLINALYALENWLKIKRNQEKSAEKDV